MVGKLFAVWKILNQEICDCGKGVRMRDVLKGAILDHKKDDVACCGVTAVSFLMAKEFYNTLPERFKHQIKKIAGGYVRIVRLGARESDGTEVARLEWAYPILVEKPKQDDKITNSKHQKPKKSQISNNK